MAAGNNILAGTKSLVFGYDLKDESSFKGEPTTNILPSPQHNGSFTTSNSWGTYNTNQYNSNNYFSIGNVSHGLDTFSTSNSTRLLRTYDVLRAQTSGAGVTAGTNYHIKRVGSGTPTYSLYTHNGNQNGSQGYINPETGKHKVFDNLFKEENKVTFSAGTFPDMWWGPPHQPNSALVKEVVEGAGYRRGSNCMRLHKIRPDSVTDGMAYNIYSPVTQGDIITVSYWHRAATPDAVGRQVSWSTYFGSGFSSVSQNYVLGEYMEWQKFTKTWTASNTIGFYQYFWLDGQVGTYAYDIADIQVEIKDHATPFVAGTRSVTESLYDVVSGSALNLTYMTFDSNSNMVFDGSNTKISVPNGGWGADMSIEMVVKVDNFNNGMLITPQSEGIDHYIRVNSNNTISMNVVLGPDTSSDSISTGALNTNQYYHIVFIKTGTGIGVYVDGVYVGDKTPQFTVADWSGTWILGQRGNNTNWFRGELPVLRVYNKPLKDSEIAHNATYYNSKY